MITGTQGGYSSQMSSAAMVAVYKANCAISPYSPFSDWRNLSYATRAGIVFG